MLAGLTKSSLHSFGDRKRESETETERQRKSQIKQEISSSLFSFQKTKNVIKLIAVEHRSQPESKKSCPSFPYPKQKYPNSLINIVIIGPIMLIIIK